jgi:hypothetical protein
LANVFSLLMTLPARHDHPAVTALRETLVCVCGKGRGGGLCVCSGGRKDRGWAKGEKKSISCYCKRYAISRTLANLTMILMMLRSSLVPGEAKAEGRSTKVEMDLDCT